MLTPFYDRDGVKIYCGDCLEVMTELDGPFDAVITDPPFPGLKGHYSWDYPTGGVAPYIHAAKAVGTPWGESLEWTSRAWELARYGVVVFCSHHNVAEVRMSFPEAHAMGLVSWYKRNAPPRGKNVPRYNVQFIWLLKKGVGIQWDAFDTMLIDVPFLSAGCFASERILQRGTKKALHPCQKPLEVIHRLIIPGMNSILDPFMGLGTTLVAAQQLGRRAVGIDISEEYCKIAVERLRQPSFWSIPESKEVMAPVQMELADV